MPEQNGEAVQITRTVGQTHETFTSHTKPLKNHSRQERRDLNASILDKAAALSASAEKILEDNKNAQDALKTKTP